MIQQCSCSKTKSVTLKSKEYSMVRVIISLLVLMERIWIFCIAAPFFSILSAGCRDVDIGAPWTPIRLENSFGTCVVMWRSWFKL